MIEHTHNLSQYGVVIGRKVCFFKRPDKTRQKGYREPRPFGEQWYRNKKLAERAAKRFAKPLIN